MSNNKERREALAQKFPEVEQHFQAIKEGIYEPPIEHLGQTNNDQKQRNQD